MEVSARIEGLNEAMAAMAAAFPANETKQRGILNASMRAAAAQTILVEAKQRALNGDSSRSLSVSLGIRATSKRKLKAVRAVAGVEIAPIRYDRKAIALYIQHYYTRLGKNPDGKTIVAGIRHGHLVEFGSVNNTARPFLWPAAQSGFPAYQSRFASDLAMKTEAAVTRAAKRGKR